MKRIAKIFAVVVMTAAAMSFAIWMLGNLSLGYLFPRTITDSLKDPHRVSEIRESGLLLEDGRVVPIPWIAQVPTKLQILNDAVDQGVEIDSKGRVFGLVRIHHWCGNDPVKKHIARVDLSNMLIAWGAKTSVSVPEDLLPSFRKQRYMKSGWNISDYIGTRHTVEILEMESEADQGGGGKPAIRHDSNDPLEHNP